MKINLKVTNAEFEISKDMLIRYKKGYGFWIVKRINESWVCALNGFQCNPLAVGFKENYEFGYEDLRPYFFKHFDNALSISDKVDSYEYWEYNKHTHEKIFDTTLRKGRLRDITTEIVKGVCNI